MWTETVLPQAPAALARLEHGGRLLDIEAGAGFALIHYAHRLPAAEIVGVDFDEPSYLLARQAVADPERVEGWQSDDPVEARDDTMAGVGDLVEVRHDDPNQLADVDAYDLVTMSTTLHETGGPDEYRNVLARAHRALNPGGTLLVAALPYPDSPEAYRAEPAYRTLAGVQLHHALVGCGSITQAELPELLHAAASRANRPFSLVAVPRVVSSSCTRSPSSSPDPLPVTLGVGDAPAWVGLATRATTVTAAMTNRRAMRCERTDAATKRRLPGRSGADRARRRAAQGLAAAAAPMARWPGRF